MRGVSGLSADKELKQRAALAERIRQYADRDALQPRVVRVELLTPSEAPAPEAAVCTFDRWADAERELPGRRQSSIAAVRPTAIAKWRRPLEPTAIHQKHFAHSMPTGVSLDAPRR